MRDPEVFLVNIEPTEGRNYTKLPVRHVNTEFCFVDDSNHQRFVEFYMSLGD